MPITLLTTPPPFRLRILRSGSGGNAILIDALETRVLVDAGLPAELLTHELAALAIKPEDLTAILLTHEHDDHARGAEVLGRLAQVPVLANEGTIREAGPALAGARFDRFITGQPFQVGTLMVEAFAVPHDAAEPVGFAVRGDGVQAMIATDLGAVTDEMIAYARAADVVVLEANYDLRLLSVSPYPWFLKNRILSTTGHLSNDAAARAVVTAASSRPQQVFLVHLSDVNNLTPLARDTVQGALDQEGITHILVEAVRPNGASRLWESRPSPRPG